MTDTQLQQERAEEVSSAARVVPGRECGTCMLCCKVMAIDEISKPACTWCVNIVRGQGCKIYDTRPTECRSFYCHWMFEKTLTDEWKPERAKFVLVVDRGGHITAFADTGAPTAWRKAPYYGVLQHWAREGIRANPARIVMARIGTRGVVILPDREIDVGTLEPGESIRLEGRPDGTVTAHKFRPDNIV